MKTSYHGCRKIDPRKHAPIRISARGPRFAVPYQLAGCCEEITPAWEVVRLSATDPEGFVGAYFHQQLCGGSYSNRVVARRVKEIRRAIDAIAGGREPVLLCFCKGEQTQYCHRRLFAQWWQDETGERVKEL